MKEQETVERLDASQVQVGLSRSEANTNVVWSDRSIEDPVEETQSYRAGAYGLLAALLRKTPDQALLDHISALSEVSDDKDELAVSLSMLGLAASHC